MTPAAPPAYREFLPEPLLQALARHSQPHPGIPGLLLAPGLLEEFSDILTNDALEFVCWLYRASRDELFTLLQQRSIDRTFMDQATLACVEPNRERHLNHPDYASVIGQHDATGRLVIGPHPETCTPDPVDVPPFMRGEQVTLFGPPDTARMSINAMNAWHRRPADEDPLVQELVESWDEVPRWGADNEDSKTPIMRDFLRACRNLIGCFEGNLTFDAGDKAYRLATTRRSLPIKRIPGLALPDGNHLLDGEPLPLHLLDFALHLFHNRNRAEALVFYVPKLENEEEATYLQRLIARAEARIHQFDPRCAPGRVKVLLVFENPRAIFRMREMAHALTPYFIGGSLGWHDFLGSTARLFRHDPHYRIPVKADPDIVINHIRESHHLLVRALQPLGAITIGGMYGVLYEANNPASWQVAMVGFIRDVVTQLKRGLTGYWVAHPDFVRIGLALVAAWRRGPETFATLVQRLVPDPAEAEPLLRFIRGDDVPGLAIDDPRYARGVLAATVGVSEVIANHDPEEVRYNIFQALQYVADWLCGNGCVALPATLNNASGEAVFVRIMDDLATTERSRWEVWAEVRHQRITQQQFDRLLDDEVAFLRADRSTAERRIQVRWRDEAARWYPIAVRLVRQLMCDPEPVEFATELLLPFTLDPIRNADDPWAAACRLCPGKYRQARQ